MWMHDVVDYVCLQWSASKMEAALFLAVRAKIRRLRSVMLDGELDRISTLCTVHESEHIWYDTA